MDVIADFQADLGSGVAGIVRPAGFDVRADCDAETACSMYGNLLFRSIPPRPRAVARSSELLARQFEPAIEEALAKIEACSLAGRNFNPYLSTNLHDPPFQDPLLNEWRVHHLHLDLPDDTPARIPGFARRTG